MLTLKRASKSRPSGTWSDDDYDVFDGEQHIGRIMLHPQAPLGEPWFWTITARVPNTMHDRGYAATREAAMANLKARWSGSLSVAYFDQCGGLEGDFSVASSRRNRSLPMGTYLHSQRSRVHWASGKWGTVLPEYSTPNCARTASQASCPGKIRTPRNNPNLCAFLSARNERAIWDGVLRIPCYYQAARTSTLEHAISA